MRIVYVSWEYPPQFGGGISPYVDSISRALAARGHDITVLTIGQAAHPTRETVSGVDVIRWPAPRVTQRDASGQLHAWRQRAADVELMLHKLGAHVDLVEFCDYRGEGAAYLAGPRSERRPVCVVRLHTPLSVLNAYNPARARSEALEEWENQALREADHLVSPSSALANEMRRRLPGLPRISLSPHPVDPVFLEQAPRLFEDDSVLYVGRVEQRKGVETLLRSAEALLRACPEARLKIVGGDTPLDDAHPSLWKALWAGLPAFVRERIIRIPRLPREQLIAHYQSARICVFPAHFDNFPNTCLEAMALARPIIAGAHSGMAEMLEDGVSGVLVESGSADALAGELIALYRAPGTVRRGLGAAARRRVGERYHPDVIAAEVERLYAGFCAGARRAAAPSARARSAPPVAVVIPCYNQGAFLEDALHSVQTQTYRPIECIIVDDGSTDPRTLERLDDARKRGVSVLRQDNAGLAAARNAGVRATDAPFYVPLDADDTLEPQFIEALLPALQNDDDQRLGFSYGQVRYFGAESGEWRCLEYDPRHLLVENLSVATALIRRRAFDDVGGYSPEMILGFEDWDFWIALLSLGYHGQLTPRVLFNYRRHPGGSMLTRALERRDEMMRVTLRRHAALFRAVAEVEPDLSGAPGDALYRDWLARAELEALERSRFWRATRWLRGGAPQPVTETSTERLSRMRAHSSYRLIQRIKQSAAYRWYARRKYGPDAS